MAKKKAAKHDDSKLWAFLGVFLTVIGFIIVLLTQKDDDYAMYYGKVGLVLFLGWVIVGVCAMLPWIGILIYIVGTIGLLILWVMGLIGALSGEKKHLPLVTDFANKIDL